MHSELTLFVIGKERRLGEAVARALAIEPAPHEERGFEDGEHKLRPLASVRGHDVYVLQSLHGEPGASVNDKLCRLLFFVATLADAGAARVTAVAPYLCYMRKDRRTKPRDPVTSRYLAAMFEASGADRVVCMDVHNLAAYQNAFRVPAEHLEARLLFADEIVARVGNNPVAVVSPDAGGVKRAERLRERLERLLGRGCAPVFLEKRRSEGVVSGAAVVGDVDGADCVIVDDLIASGTTMARAARALRQRGARSVLAVATHGVFGIGAAEALAEPALERILVSDSIPPGGRLPPALIERKLTVVGVAPLIAEAIWRLHHGGSLVDLLEGSGGAQG